MYYTILTSEDLASGQKIDFIKNGNKYTISFGSEKDNIFVRFSDKEKATEIYKEMIEYFIGGLYSYEQRKEIILKGGNCE